jgi:hypothetical protein
MSIVAPPLARIEERYDDDDVEQGLSHVSESDTSWVCRSVNNFMNQENLQEQEQILQKKQQNQKEQEQLQDLLRWTQNQQPAVPALQSYVERDDDVVSKTSLSESSELQKIIIQHERGRGQGKLDQQQEQREQQLGEKNWQLQHAIQAELASHRSNIPPDSQNVEQVYYRK